MSALAHDGLIGAAAVLIGLSVFLISLALLEVANWLAAWIVAGLSPSAARSVQVRSALAAVDDHRE